MVISSLVVEATPGKIHAAADALEEIPGVEVHNREGYKIVVTIEAETVGESHDIASSFIAIDGVTGASLIYANFEDDPSLKTCGERQNEAASGEGAAAPENSPLPTD